MAFERMLQRGGALGGFGLVDEHIEEVVHDAAVAAAVTLEVVCKELDIDDFFRLAEDADVDFIREHIGFDLTVRAHGLEITVALFGERAHGEAHGGAVLEEEVRLLVVDDVVVAHIDAAAVLTVFQCFIGALFGGVHAAGNARHPRIAVADARCGVRDVDLLGVELAVFLRFAAAEAVRRCALRCALLFEEVRIADGGNGLTLFAEQPGVDVHIVAALLEDHGACLVAVTPVAAHKGVRLMPVADVLVCTDGDDIADLFAVENGL